MKSVRAACRVRKANGRVVGFWKKMAVIAGGAFAFVEEWRAPQLLAIARQADVWQALLRFEEIIDARLGIGIEAEVFPKFIYFDKCARLRVLAIFAFEKFLHDIRVTLIPDPGP